MSIFAQDPEADLAHIVFYQKEMTLTDKPCGVEQALYHALRFEEATLKSSDTEKRWDINPDEKKIVLKWMHNRMEDIRLRL